MTNITCDFFKQGMLGKLKRCNGAFKNGPINKKTAFDQKSESDMMCIAIIELRNFQHNIFPSHQFSVAESKDLL